eukprot:CAMPEP_0198726412 /NCGR_PEP_ID=MMETSP1475-20131203/3462_1 /TAXON_ID= ORGANISM="Unidentified sp., Strain CCMP1999" /NCGR_SAMPLE_ID=MMETSP1475 /ASSEMBLY_ACC=CAM_ASM_001111 /LENGTH=244 /DNA_ID=CAMNT_0044488321 /DNA_START=52 /DNA_END=786 /DNA_ORIENTATION=+
MRLGLEGGTSRIVSVVAVIAIAGAMDILARMLGKKVEMVKPEGALPGRPGRMPLSEDHAIFGTPLDVEFSGTEMIQLGMGCFWGAERKFWNLPGVVSTAVGYAGGYTENPTYREVCSGMTGHAEVVRVVFDPKRTNLENILATFWESHNPTQGDRQGNDTGTQYRSAIYYYNNKQKEVAEHSKNAYQELLYKEGHGQITTEVAPAKPFYFAESYHQQYLAKNPSGYCGLGGTGVACPVSLIRAQ